MGKHGLPLDKHTVVHNFDISGKKTKRSHLHQGYPKTFSQICFYLCSSHSKVFVVYLCISGLYMKWLTPHACTLGLKSLGMLRFRPTLRWRCGRNGGRSRESEWQGLEFWPLLASVTKSCIMFAYTVTSRVRPGHRKPRRLNKLISCPLNNTSASFCCFTEVLFSYRTRGCSCILSQGACQRLFCYFYLVFGHFRWELVSSAFICHLFLCLAFLSSHKAKGWVAWIFFFYFIFLVSKLRIIIDA